MGSGRANIDLPLIMKILALVFCAVAVGLNVAAIGSDARNQLVSNSTIYSSGAYLIILLYLFIWSIAKSEVDQKFAAIILICGFLWTVGAGIGVILFKCDYSSMVGTNQLVGGILVLVAGCVMLADGIHNLEFTTANTKAAMGKGRGLNINMDFIFRLIEIILLIVGLAMFMITSNQNFDGLVGFRNADLIQASDAMCITGSIFVIALLIMVLMQLIKGEEQDQQFVGWLAVIGTILLISTGIAVCVIGKDASTDLIISGVMAIMGGLALLVEALKDFGVF